MFGEDVQRGRLDDHFLLKQGIYLEHRLARLVAVLVEDLHFPMVRAGRLGERVDFHIDPAFLAGPEPPFRQPGRQAAAAGLGVGYFDGRVAIIEEGKRFTRAGPPRTWSGFDDLLGKAQVGTDGPDEKKNRSRRRRLRNYSPRSPIAGGINNP